MMANEVSADRILELSSAQITNIGDRQTNQDAQGSAQRGALACFVVSDGAGGHAGGEIASGIVVKAILDSFLYEQSFGARAMRFYVGQAVAMVANGKKANATVGDMSATIAAVLVDSENRCALWAHLGDTRIYLFRNRKLHNVTRDHSLVQQFVDAGYCPPEALRTHPQRSVLYAAIGNESETAPEMTQEAIALQDRDAILLCTDGFWEWITESEMEASLAAAASVDDWLRRMRQIVEANSANSPKFRDNYTAQALWFIERDANI
jgi:serine/threonine protein phosphatase PrpC